MVPQSTSTDSRVKDEPVLTKSGSQEDGRNYHPNAYKQSLLKTIGLLVLGTLVVGLIVVVVLQGVMFDKLRASERLSFADPPNGESDRMADENKKNQRMNWTTSEPKTSTVEVCKYNSCARAASFLLERMKTTQEPCDDFYEYACGGFLENSNLQKPGESEATTLALRLKNRYKEMLNSEEKYAKKPTEVMKAFYRQCVVAYEVAKQNNENSTASHFPILDEIAKIGKWPIIDSTWTNDDFNLTQFLINSVKTGNLNLGFLKIDIYDAHASDFNQSMIYLLGEKQDLVSDKIDKEKVEENGEMLKSQHYEKILKVLIPEINLTPSINEDIENMIAFESRIQKAFSNTSSEVADYEVLQNWIPQIDWDLLIGSFLNYRKTEELKERIKVRRSEHAEKILTNILAETSSRTLANYLIYQWIFSMKDFMQPAVSRLFDSSEQAEKDSDEQCLDILMKLFPMGMVISFGHYGVQFEEKAGVLKLVEEVKKEFEKALNDTSWIDENTKSAAKQKLENMRTDVIWPTQLEDEKKFERAYKLPAVDEKTVYFENLIRMKEWAMEKFWMEVVENEDHRLPEMFNDIKLSYYSPANKLIIPRTCTELPIFHSELPAHFNLGSLGSMIGQAMSYELYSDETRGKFQEIRQCFLSEYTSSKKDKAMNKTIYGNASINEYIADFVGLDLAYRIAKKPKGNEPMLSEPGEFDFDRMKVFLLSFAAKYCEIPVSEGQLNFDNNGKNANRFLVNGIVSNLEGFAETFRCEKGKKMNPEKKCSYF